MNPKIISIVLGVVLLSSVASFSPILVEGFDHEDGCIEGICAEDYEKDSDGDGIFDKIDVCPFVSFGTTPGEVCASAPGCPRSSYLCDDDGGGEFLDIDDFDIPVDEIDLSDIIDFVSEFGDAFFEIWEDFIQYLKELIGWG